MLASAYQGIINFFARIINSLILLLPESPFQVTGTFGEWSGWINYFIPVGQMLSVTTIWLSAVAVWYVIRWGMRFTKFIA